MDKQDYFDFVVLGGGIYGLYAALLLARKKYSVGLFEIDDEIFSRASYINQARVHKGYHYLRSVSTARASAKYFDRFCDEFKPAINNRFNKIYAISNRNSYTSHRQFLKFCENCAIPVLEINPSIYFNAGTVEGAYETNEYAFDHQTVKEMLSQKLASLKNFHLFLNKQIVRAESAVGYYHLVFSDGTKIKTRGVFNATYAGVNQMLKLFGFELLELKYEICEVIMCRGSAQLQKVGITVMDGPFFSVMPFGQGERHSLTSVEFTPHETSYGNLPDFNCQRGNDACTPVQLQNCNKCPARPKSAYIYMNQLAQKYLKPEYGLTFEQSLFSIKPIMKMSEIDDSRPTIVKTYRQAPLFASVLSGKINTIYELEGLINEI